MRVVDVVLAEKSSVAFEAWREDKPKRKDFPMSKRRGGTFPLTRKWRWTTIEFEALSCRFIVIVAYHKEVPEYQAVLAERLADDTRTLARFEYHSAHPVPGWHIHANCGDVTELEVGLTKPVGQNRIPEVRAPHRRGELTPGGELMNDNLALAAAANRFGVPYTIGLLDQVGP